MTRTARTVFAGLAFAAVSMSGNAETAPNSASPTVKIINFTADWCPNCQILNPRMAEAISRFPAGTIEIVDLDMTDASRRADDETRANTRIDAIRLADSHQAGYLWDWYGGITGLAAIIAADNGEPIACMNRALSVDQIERRLEQARILAAKAPPGLRKPDGPDCPPPMR